MDRLSLLINGTQFEALLNHEEPSGQEEALKNLIELTMTGMRLPPYTNPLIRSLEDGVFFVKNNNMMPILASLIKSQNEIIRTFALWTIANLCYHGTDLLIARTLTNIDDDACDAFFREGALERLQIVSNLPASGIEMEKCLAAITNLAKNAVVRRELGHNGVLQAIIGFLDKFEALDSCDLFLQAVVNLVCEDEPNQTICQTALPAFLRILNSEDTHNFAHVVVILFHMSCSTLGCYAILQADLLSPLSKVFENPNISVATKDVLLATIANLSCTSMVYTSINPAHFEDSEKQIIDSGILFPVLDLMGLNNASINTKALILLTNLALDAEQRIAMRTYGWVGPITKILEQTQNIEDEVYILAIKAVMNLSPDPYCRKLLIDSPTNGILIQVSKTNRSHIADLAKKALANLAVPIPSNILTLFKEEISEYAFDDEDPLQLLSNVDKFLSDDPLIFESALSRSPSGRSIAKQPEIVVRTRTATMSKNANDEPTYARRARVAKELLETEESYVSALEFIVNSVIRPIRAQQLLSEQELKDIFSVSEALLVVHVEFRAKLRALLEKFEWNTCISSIVLEVTSVMKIYKPYINNYDLAIKSVEQFMAKKKAFAQFLKDQGNKVKELRFNGLSHYLIQPIQRVPRYVLLIDQLLKFTPPTHFDYEKLSFALGKMRELTEFLNEAKRTQESTAKLIEIQSRLISQEHDIVNSYGRVLIREASFTQEKSEVVSEKRNTKTGKDATQLTSSKRDTKNTKESKKSANSRFVSIYLFNDALLVTAIEKKFLRQSSLKPKMKVVLLANLEEHAVKVEDSEGSTSPRFAVYTKLSADPLILSATSPEEKMEWVRLINNTILKITEREQMKEFDKMIDLL